MRKNIHPRRSKLKVTCSCGNVMEVESTLEKDFTVDVCSNCHSFYTGSQKLSDTTGRIESFNRRFANMGKAR